MTKPRILLYVNDPQGAETALAALQKSGAEFDVVRVESRDEFLRKVAEEHYEVLIAEQTDEAPREEIDRERERLQTIIGSIPGVIYELMSDRLEELKCTFVSPNIKSLTGYTAEEWISLERAPSGLGRLHPDDVVPVSTTLERIWRTGEDDVIQHRCLTKSGGSIWLESYVTPIKLDGKIAGLRGVSIDISKRKSAESERDYLLTNAEDTRDKISLLLQSVEESEQRYKVIAEAMPVIVWSSDPAGAVTYLNERWVQYTGKTREESYSQSLKDFVHPEDFPSMQEKWTDAMLAGEDFEAELRLRDKNAIFNWFLVRAVAVRDQDGRIVQWIGTSTPLNEQKRTRENLKFLAEASEILASSLDYETTLKSVAQLAVPKMADWCSVDIVSAEGEVERLAVAHVDPEKVAWSYELEKKYPADRNAPTGIPNVIRTGKSEFYPTIPRELLLAGAQDEEHLRIIDMLDIRSAMVVPLVARGFVVGVISFIGAESGRIYTEDDLALAEDIGRRAGVAIDNAWLYRKSQEEVAERKRVEEAVRLSETRFRTLVEQSPLSIQIYSSDGYCLQANAAWEWLFNTKRDQLEGYNILTDPQLDKKGIRAYIEQAFRGESVTIPPVYYVPEEIGRVGRGRWVRAFMYPIKEAGDLREVALILEDVTDRLEFEEALKTAKESAESANQAKDKFLAILSHELRTPLTPVLTTVQILEMDEKFPDEYREWLDIIHRNVELEARLIDDLLDLTRIAKGKLKLNLETIDLHRLIKHVIDIYRGEIGQKQLNLTTDLSAELSHVDGDPARLQQVLWNLVKNAVKFTPQGGAITIRSKNIGENIVIEVEDTGIGIDTAVLPRIFDAFEQGEQTITRNYGGLGLGLAISKNLVDLHDGKIYAASKGRNAGARFVIELQSSPSLAQAEATALPASANSSARPSLASILLVDDHVDTSLALKLLLERRGFEVVSANTVESAIETIKKRSKAFDILVTDIGLPDGSGRDIISFVKRDNPEAKAIALSGFGTDEDIRMSREAGFEEHLTKPFSFQKLEEVVQRLLKRK